MRQAEGHRHRTALGLALAATALTGSSCGTGQRVTDTSTVQVYAASSLSGAFPRIATRFEQQHPGTHVALTFAGSSELESQLAAGAPGDVFASADETTMRRAVDDQLVAEPQHFASNTLVIVTAPGNPLRLNGVQDLARPGLDVVVCAPQVPCGAATARALAAARTTLHPASEESAVTGVLGSVTSGQADAGIVYVTDARRAGRSVTTVPFPQARSVVNRYPIAVLSRSRSSAATEFVDLVRSPEGQAVLRDAGFAP